MTTETILDAQEFDLASEFTIVRYHQRAYDKDAPMFCKELDGKWYSTGTWRSHYPAEFNGMWDVVFEPTSEQLKTMLQAFIDRIVSGTAECPCGGRNGYHFRSCPRAHYANKDARYIEPVTALSYIDKMAPSVEERIVATVKPAKMPIVILADLDLNE